MEGEREGAVAVAAMSGAVAAAKQIDNQFDIM